MNVMCVKVRATEDQLKSLGIIDSQILDLLLSGRAFAVEYRKNGVLYGLSHPETRDVFVALPQEYCERIHNGEERKRV